METNSNSIPATTNQTNNSQSQITSPQSTIIKDSPSVQQQQQSLITDFSSIFKRKSVFTANSKKSIKYKPTATKTPNWLLQIPAKLEITIQDLQTRRCMDTKKWMSVSKTAEQWKKIVAAVCSCWNYLQSQKGIGKRKYLTLNQCLNIVNKTITVQQIQKLNQNERYNMVERILQILNKQMESKLAMSIIKKLAHPNQLQSSPKQQKQLIINNTASTKKFHIYLTYNDILLPIGFDKTPLKQIQAYEKIQNISEQNQQLWVISSSLGRCEPSFCIKRWTDIQKDLQTVWPNYFDIKEAKQGIRVRPEANQENMAQNRGTSNCIIQIYLNQ